MSARNKLVSDGFREPAVELLQLYLKQFWAPGEGPEGEGRTILGHCLRKVKSNSRTVG